MLGLRIVGGVSVGYRALRAYFEPEVLACWQFFVFSISRPASCFTCASPFSRLASPLCLP